MANDGGINSFNRAIDDVIRESKVELRKALLKSANETAGLMQSLVPVDQGDLRDSIAVTQTGERTPAHSQPGGSMVVRDNQIVITAGNSEVRYPHLVEYGTQQAPAQPYFWPATRLLKARNTRRIKRAVSKAVKENWGRL